MVCLERWIVVLLVVFLALPAVHAGENWDFSGKKLLVSLENVARTGKLNLIVNSPDREISSCSLPLSSSMPDVLQALAEAAGCVADKVGDCWLIVDKELWKLNEDPEWLVVQAPEHPVDSVFKSIQSFPPPGVRLFSVASANIGILDGYKYELEKAQKLFNASLRPGRLFLIDLKFKSSGASDSFASLRFAAIDGVETMIEFQPPGGQRLGGTVSVKQVFPGRFSLSGELAPTRARAARAKFNSEFTVGQAEVASFTLGVGKDEIICAWAVELVAEPSRLKVSQPAVSESCEESPGKNGEEMIFPVTSEAAVLLNLSVIQEPLNDVLSMIVASESGNLVCDSSCSGTISLLCFGPELYFEELMNLAARATGMGVRKIGATWMVAPAAKISDAFCRDLFSTRRLQFSDEKTMLSIIKQLINKMRITDNMRVAGDFFVNGLVYGGSGQGMSNLRKIIALLDSPPLQLSVQMFCKFGANHISESMLLPVARPFSRKLGSGSATATVELLPVCFSANGIIGLRYNYSSLPSESGVKMTGWTYLDTASDTMILSLTGNEEFEIRLNGFLSDRQIIRPEIELPPDSGDSAFDDAFDDSF